MNKIVKTSLLATAFVPMMVNFIPNQASEVVKGLPNIEEKPTEPQPNPEQPQPETPNPDKPVDPQPQPNPNPEKPNPDKPQNPNPVPPVPEIQYVYESTVQKPYIIIAQKEVGKLDLFKESGITVTKTTNTTNKPSTTVPVTPELLTQPTTTLGLQELTYGVPGTNMTWTFHVNVVVDQTYISPDRYLGILVSQPEVTINQTQAQSLATVNDFVTLNQVTGVNAKAEVEQITMPKKIGATDVFAGKVGKHNVEYGIATNPTGRAAAQPFTAPAIINVTEDPQNPIPVNPNAQVQGLVEQTSLKGIFGNQSPVTTRKGVVKTAAAVGITLPITAIAVSTIALFFVAKKRK